jgi:hypothetical protein
LVGCHEGLIESSYLHSSDRDGFGIQMKGGSKRIRVRSCWFDHAGWRGLQVGGSTGMDYFRPAPQGFEAREIVVENNLFVGSEAALTFVNVDGAVVRRNTIFRPSQWVMRILQETVREGFVPCRNVVFADNIVAFRSDELQTTVNVGARTAPETFRFARNFWYCLDAPGQSRPSLPTPEEEGRFGVDPQFVDVERNDFHLKAGSSASSVGAYSVAVDSAPKDRTAR